jgi:amino acid permease
MMQSRRAVDRYLTEEAAEQQDLAFFEALTEGRELPVRPTIRDLERYALTFTEIVGASILALPIALAGVGPLARVVVLVVMGVINVLTIAAMAEAVTHSGSIRYQGSYLGRLIQDYLGRAGSLILTTMVLTICFLIIFAYYLGFSLTLAGATPIPAEDWVGVLFLIGVYFVRRKNLHATISSALVVGMINLGLILILSVLALGHLRVENLTDIHVPYFNGRSFEQALLGLIFGVAVMAGVFPVLLLWASRRKGEHLPGFVLPFLAHPAVSGSIYLVAVGILFLHGLGIWQNAFQRVIEVRQDPAATEQWHVYGDRLRSAKRWPRWAKSQSSSPTARTAPPNVVMKSPLAY